MNSSNFIIQYKSYIIALPFAVPKLSRPGWLPCIGVIDPNNSILPLYGTSIFFAVCCQNLMGKVQATTDT